MIKNIVFDLGNVLIEYNPQKFIIRNVKEENFTKFNEVVFKSKEWLDLDRGILEYNRAVEIFSEKLPEERESIKYLFDNSIQDVLFPIEENLELLSNLKRKGYKLYILSNFHREAYLEIAKKCNFDRYFDGGVISYDINLLKPEEEIYRTLLKKYDLLERETLFIDDTLNNVEKASELGIETIHLTEKSKLKEELERVLKMKI
ncbi:HAD family phosphatase [Fusobacterium sp.]|uniref:HAD family hydrolase n=1 Tax=Fusobacterium sp. TaxID=68766 RepID=UPI00261254DA|nr:HAD family phosphatase [Fusobacterium sp.]